MGTKRELAPAVADVIGQAREGILLDAFSGMCSVGEQVAPARQVWSNDAQFFSSEVARALFVSRDAPPRTIFSADTIFPEFESHSISLSAIFQQTIEAEQRLLEVESFASFRKHQNRLAKALSSEITKSPIAADNLFSVSYSCSYFGIQQAIDIDAIVKSINLAVVAKKISIDHRRWMLIALGRALLKVANTTGHFAQFLKPNERSYKRFIRQRRRSVWEEWIFSTGELHPVGDLAWRKRNRCFNEDSLALLPKLRRIKNRPAVVYADPPYTDDQYSRFYHILETLLLYDYPTVSGAGLYRGNRFATPFSQVSKVVGAFDALVGSVAGIGADLVLSYPTNGLLYEAQIKPEQIFRKHFKHVERRYSATHNHSTFGASKGTQKAKVTEVIYLARL